MQKIVRSLVLSSPVAALAFVSPGASKPADPPLLAVSAHAQQGGASKDAQAKDFAERRAVLETIRQFYIGDKTGSLAAKERSMHPMGAYRYVDRKGEFKESRFRLVEGGADTSYTEELLSVDIYGKTALARLRLAKKKKPTATAEYKLMSLHKVQAGWRITGISWGFGVTR